MKVLDDEPIWGRRSLWPWEGIAGALALLFLLCTSSLLLPEPASAIDPSLCDDDGVTEVPPFAEGRDGNQCLSIDPGNGDPNVLFQYEFFHKRGVSRSSMDSGESYANFIDLELLATSGCPTKGSRDYCSAIVWDTTIDNYLHTVAKNDDIITLGAVGYEYLYFKNTNLANGWKCGKSLNGWSGPNGIGCAKGEGSGAHSDGVQLISTMRDGGWLIVQDSNIVNAHIALFRTEHNGVSPDVLTNFLFQGSQLGTINTTIGASKTWINDCDARASSPGADAACRSNRIEGAMPVKEIWYIDVTGNSRSKLGTEAVTTKVVVVNTGAHEYKNGWPHPINHESSTGPGVCPNGYIGTCSALARCFCYSSIENALNDVPTSTAKTGDCPAPVCPHKAPPFIQLSSAGWKTPPDPWALQRPPPPVILP